MRRVLFVFHGVREEKGYHLRHSMSLSCWPESFAMEWLDQTADSRTESTENQKWRFPRGELTRECAKMLLSSVTKAAVRCAGTSRYHKWRARTWMTVSGDHRGGRLARRSFGFWAFWSLLASVVHLLSFVRRGFKELWPELILRLRWNYSSLWIIPFSPMVILALVYRFIF